MPSKNRYKTKYPGIYYIEGKNGDNERKEHVFYMIYRKNGKQIEKRIGSNTLDAMTSGRAASVRAKLVSALKKDSQRQEDINSRKKHMEEKWILFMKSATDAFSLFDSSLNFLEFNDALLHILAIEKKDLIGKNLLDISPEIKGTPDYENLMNVMKTGKPYVKEDFIIPSRFGDDKHCNFKIFKVRYGLGIIMRDITEQKRAELKLIKREAELGIKTKDLEEVNTALRVLLLKREEDKSELKKNILFSINKLIAPYIEELKKSGLVKKRQKTLLSIIESNLDEITSSFARRMAASLLKLTPMEIRITNLIKQGYTTKEVAELLNLSPKTINCHRENIRDKLGIKNKKINLRTYLISEE